MRLLRRGFQQGFRQDRYGCSTAKNKGTCDNTRTIRQDVLENAVLNALQKNLLDKSLVTAFCEEYTRHLNYLHSSRNSTVEKARKERAKLESDRSRLIEAIKNGIPVEEIRGELEQIAQHREELDTILNQPENPPTLVHPTMASR